MVTLLLIWLAAQAVSASLVWVFNIDLGRHANIENPPRVVVIVAVKGPDFEFEHFLAHIFAQDYPSFRAIFSVEAIGDPAVAQIEAWRSRRPGQIAIVVAGLSQDEGQKSANLRAALKQIAAGDEVVVFADANIRPARDWLIRLVAPLMRGDADIVSGFAWIVVKNRALASYLLASMSAALVAIPRLPLLNAAWGGSTAMRREVCQALDLDRAWRGTLSDDLQVTAVAQRAGYTIAAPREILLRSFVASGGLRDVISEAMRWLLLFRVYLPATFALAIAGLTFSAAGWLAAFAGALTGHGAAAEILLAAFMLMLLRTAGRALIVARLWGRPGLKENRLFFVLDPLLAPWAAILTAACGWAALCTRRTTWAGTTYEIRGPQQVRVVARVKQAQQS
jgi:hypothetical protein